MLLMPDTVQTIVYSMICVFAGGCVKGLTGFGFSLVTVASLVLVAAPGSVVPVVMLMNSVMNLFLIVSVRREIELRRALTLGLAGMAGLPLGTYILVKTEADILRIIIGVIILLFATAFLLGVRREIGREHMGSALVGVESWSTPILL